MDFKSLLELNIGDMVYEHYTNSIDATCESRNDTPIESPLKIVGFFVSDTPNDYRRFYTSKSLDFISNAIKLDRRATIGVILEMPDNILADRGYFFKISPLGVSFSYQFIEKTRSDH